MNHICKQKKASNNNMVKYNPKDWFSLIFKFHKSDTFRKLLPTMLAIAAYTGVIAYLEIEIFGLSKVITTTLHSMLGFVISLLLVFRTNTAYERWWEGRKQWGALVNASRNLANKLTVLVGNDNSQLLHYLGEQIGNFATTLKMHLRGKKTTFAPEDVHQPNHIAQDIFKQVYTLKKEGKLSTEDVLLINMEMTALMDICGACERIRKTPIPFSYSLFLKKFIFMYTITLPFGLVKDFGYYVVLAVVFIFYVLASLELIAEEIEDPFGTDANDLPTDEIAAMIVKNVDNITNQKI